MQERVSRIDKKLQENIEPRRNGGAENQNPEQDVDVIDNGRKPEGDPTVNPNQPLKQSSGWTPFGESVLGDVLGKEKGVIVGGPKFLEEQIGLSKAKAKAELRRLIEESDGSMFTRGKLYHEWMERVPFLTGFKRPVLPVFKGKVPAKQHLRHVTMWTGGFMENDTVNNAFC